MQEAFRAWCQRNQIEPATKTYLQRMRSSTYLTKIKVSDAEMLIVQITPYTSHGEWKDTIVSDRSKELCTSCVVAWAQRSRVTFLREPLAGNARRQ